MPYYAPFQRPMYYNPSIPQDNLNMASGQPFGQPYHQPAQAAQMPSQQPTMTYTAQNTPTNDFIWVQGEAGAKAYLVAPNNTVTLWDSESPTIYIKTADINGVPSMRVLDFTERTANVPKTEKEHVCKCGKDFVKIDTFNELEAKFDDLAKKFESFSQKRAPKTTKTVETEEE